MTIKVGIHLCAARCTRRKFSRLVRGLELRTNCARTARHDPSPVGFFNEHFVCSQFRLGRERERFVVFCAHVITVLCLLSGNYGVVRRKFDKTYRCLS